MQTQIVYVYNKEQLIGHKYKSERCTYTLLDLESTTQLMSKSDIGLISPDDNCWIPEEV